jgi:signal peptidase
MDWKNELREIGEGIIIAVLLYLVIQACFMVTMGVEKPLYVVISGSMEPVYEEGDILIVKSTDINTITEGDIIVFDPPFGGIPIVHRVFQVIETEGSRYFITKGDSNPFPDTYYQETYPGIPKEHIIGKPLMKIPKLGLIQIWVREFFNVIRCPSLQPT